MKYILFILIFITSSNAMPLYDLTGNTTLDFIYSLNINLGLIVWIPALIMRLLKF